MTLVLLAGAGFLGYLFLKKKDEAAPPPQRPTLQLPQVPQVPLPQVPHMPTTPPPSTNVPIVPPFGSGGTPVLYTSSMPMTNFGSGGNLGTSYSVRTDLNVRQSASASSTRVGGFSTGTSVISLGEAQGDWIKVTGINTDTGMPVSGWVMKSYLQEQAPTVPSGSTWMGEI